MIMDINVRLMANTLYLVIKVYLILMYITLFYEIDMRILH